MTRETASPPEVVLTTDRLILRPWRVSEATVQRALWAERDPRVPPHRRIDADGRPTVQDLAERIRHGAKVRTVGLLAVERQSSGDVIGYCGLIPTSQGQPGEPELAFEFFQAVWNQGYATESAVAVLGWAQESGFQRLWATVREWNRASLRVLIKVGFSESGRVETDLAYGDSLVMSRQLPVAGSSTI